MILKSAATISQAIFFLLLALAVPARAFTQDTVSIRSSIDRTSIIIGERIRLIYQAEIPENMPIRFFEIDTIDHFEFISKGKIDTVNTSFGTSLRQEIILTSFDSGQWLIPSYPLHNLQSDSFLIDVGFTPFDTSRGYHGIKDIIEVEESKDESSGKWIAAIVLTVITLIAIYFLIGKKKPKPASPIIEEDPFLGAKKNLAMLKESDLPSKEFYFALIDIFRIYLVRRKNILSMNKTTDDLVVQLRSLNLETDFFKELAQELRRSDLVKFAKFDASGADRQSSLELIEKSIERIENNG